MRPSVEERFWAKVKKTDGCWLWTGSLRQGYGQFGVRAGLVVKASRFAWELTNGPIPPGMLACHTCDVKACVRPDHLFIGTQVDNMRDAATKGRIVIPNQKWTPDLLAQARALISGGMTQRAAAKTIGMSESRLSTLLHR